MSDEAPDPPEVAFGRELRRLREAEGWSLIALGKRVRYSGTAVGNFELAKRPVPEEFLDRAAEVFGDKSTRLVELWRDINPAAKPTWFRRWPGIEGAAILIRSWEPLIMPGLLQVPDYARAVLRGVPGATHEEVEEALEARLRRQEILSQSRPPMFVALLDEGVLQRPIGGQAVMVQQLRRLLELTEHPKITIQVVPLTSGVTTGLLGGFAIALLPDKHVWAYLEAASTGQVTDRADETQAITLRFDTIRAWALPVQSTRDVITETIARYEQ